MVQKKLLKKMFYKLAKYISNKISSLFLNQHSSSKGAYEIKCVLCKICNSTQF